MKSYTDSKSASMSTRVEVLELKESDGVFTWEPVRVTWARITMTGKRNNFSVHGIGAAGAAFGLRRQPLTLANAIRFNGQHCFLTGILPVDYGHLAVDAALVVVSQCEDRNIGISFPAVMTEKYVRFQEPTPYGDNEYTHILVTPKAIALKPGLLVEVEGIPWHIRTAHLLDPYKNEFEIWREVEH